MRKNIHEIIQVIAFVMFIAGIIFSIVSIKECIYAGKGYYTRDPVGQMMWGNIAVQSVITTISSILVYGFSFIVQAACKYLDKCEEENTAE